MDDQNIHAVIGKSFLANVDADVVEELTRRARIREVSAGRVFITEAEGPRCGIVVAGFARVFTIRADGSQTTQRRVTVGSGIGIHAMVGRRSRVRVQAITDIEFLQLDPDLIVQMARRHSMLAVAVAEELDRRLADTEAQVECLQGRVIQKLASTLLDLSTGRHPLEVHMSQEHLAETIGASREHVGQELRRLATSRVVKVARAHVHIIDPGGLQVIAAGGALALIAH